MATLLPSDNLLTLPDNRTLSYAEFGKIDSPLPPILFFHGFPGTHAEASTTSDAAKRKGLRVVGITRPGYGHSSFQTNRTMLDFATDVIAVADHLGARRFAVAGVSGGAPYVFACLHHAAVVPGDRLLGAAVISGIYPTKLGLQGMMMVNRILLAVAPWTPGPVVSAVFDLAVGRVARGDPEAYEKAMLKDFESRPPEDLQAIKADDGKMLKVLMESTRDALRDGGKGSAWEAKLLGSDWGFELGELKFEPGRLVLWHGGRDVNCPVGMANKAKDLLLPGVELRVCEEEAHVSLFVNKMDEIMGVLEGFVTGG